MALPIHSFDFNPFFFCCCFQNAFSISIWILNEISFFARKFNKNFMSARSSSSCIESFWIGLREGISSLPSNYKYLAPAICILSACSHEAIMLNLSLSRRKGRHRFFGWNSFCVFFSFSIFVFIICTNEERCAAKMKQTDFGNNKIQAACCSVRRPSP